MKQEKDFASKLKFELIVFYAFFVLTLIFGVFSIGVEKYIPITLISLTFLILNGFIIVVNLIIKATKEIVNGIH